MSSPREGLLGKTQTYLPWDSWQHPYTQNQPVVWHHDIFYPDGRPYREQEVAQILSMTLAAQKEFDGKARKR